MTIRQKTVSAIADTPHQALHDVWAYAVEHKMRVNTSTITIEAHDPDIIAMKIKWEATIETYD